MAGIYLHIPFCKQACHYCDFHFSTSLKYKQEMLEAMRKELALQKYYLAEAEIETVYFGGGTPSLLSGGEISSFLDQIARLHTLSSGAEITIEANPDDLSTSRVNELRHTGINRFSIGIQSFFGEDLAWMNRAHTSSDAERSVKTVQDAGFENISIDLIYGYPLLTDEKWKKNINMVLDLKVPHISAYSMTVEPRTALAAFIRKSAQAPMDDKQGASQFAILMKTLDEGGFDHYEISNFALPGMYSRHNSNYWMNIPYLGIGPSAHSFNKEQRQWNIAGNAKYLESLKNNIIPAETEIITTANRVNEYIMTSVRTMWGMDLGKIEAEYGPAVRNKLEGPVRKFINSGQLKRDENIVTLTTQGKFFADMIAAELFVE